MKRRIFLKNAAVVSAVTILKPGMAFSSRANSAIQIGIIGCGERGTAGTKKEYILKTKKYLENLLSK
jgi:hypothetical protein